MRTVKGGLLSLGLVGIVGTLTACGGAAPGGGPAGGAAAGGGGGAVTVSDPNWETMSAPGVSVSFAMPKPIKMHDDAQNGMVVYVAQKPEQKLSFKVGIVKRNLDQDRAKGMDDEAVLKTFAQRLLQASREQLAQQYHIQTQFQFDGSTQVNGALCHQYEAKAGKAIILNRFYINNQGIFWIEAITQDPNNADIQQFLNSFAI